MTQGPVNFDPLELGTTGAPFCTYLQLSVAKAPFFAVSFRNVVGDLRFHRSAHVSGRRAGLCLAVPKRYHCVQCVLLDAHRARRRKGTFWLLAPAE